MFSKQGLTRVSFSFVLLAIKEEWFCALDKKINVGNWFLAGLCAIYLVESVLHLKYEKITADLSRHLTLLDIKVSLVKRRNSCLSSGRTMQYFPPLLYFSKASVTLKRTTT